MGGRQQQWMQTRTLMSVLLLLGHAWHASSQSGAKHSWGASMLAIPDWFNPHRKTSPSSAIGSSRRLKQAEEAPRPNPVPDHASECMDLVGLKAAVEAAAWQLQPSGVPPEDQTMYAGPQASAKVVILTMCDLYCLEQLFEMWMGSLRHAAGGDNSRHVVFVALGQPAMQYCVEQQAHHPHQCVLDKACGMAQHTEGTSPWHKRRKRPRSLMEPRGPATADGFRRRRVEEQEAAGGGGQQQTGQQLSFATGGYFLALQQKLMWARQVLALNTSVLWLDVDVLVYKALLPRLVSGTLSHSDMAIAGESCDPRYKQDEEPLRFRKHGQFHQNGGLWLMHATPGGRGLMDIWAGENWRAISEGTARRKRPLLDQDVLNKIVLSRIVKTQAIQMRPDGQYTPQVNATGGNATWVRAKGLRVYKLSIQLYQNQNGGHCGCPPSWKRNDHLIQRDPFTNNITCQISQTDINKWVTMHFNGLQGMHQKVARMRSLSSVANLGALP